MTVTPASLEFAALGVASQLVAQARDQAGRILTAVPVRWQSADESVATVDSTGLVTSRDNGSTTVTARAESVAGMAQVEVSQTVHSVIVSPAADTIGVGDRVQLTAEAVDSNGHAVNGVHFEWSSSDPGVARVSPSGPGLVVGHGDGVAMITATTRGVAGTAEITVRRTDGDALRAFYEATDGLNWTRNENWLTDAPLGEWFGVGTDSQGRVRRLQLAANNLTGTIPPELADISLLSTVRLGNNSLAGPIPTGLGRLSSLWLLEMDANNLTGSIPAELGGLSQLAFLNLAGNSLSGAIPPELGNSPSLERLELHGNNLTGSVPENLGNLSSLWSLSLQENALTGPLPRKLVQLDQLRRLNFDGNDSLCAPGSRDFLTWLELVETYEGPLCNESDRAALEALYEAWGGQAWTNSDDWLTSDVVDTWYGVGTDSLGYVRSLDLSDNGLRGRLPGVLGSLVHMSELRVSRNRLSGPLPLSLAHLPLREFHYAETALCEPDDVSFGEWLAAIESRRGTGQVCGALSDRDVLVALYEATGGNNWRDNHNWLTDAPLEDWFGVTTNDDGRVSGLYLGGGHNLVGPIPPELGNLTSLTHVYLAINELTGPIPPSLGNLTQLRQLSLSHNRLSGPIPPELGNLADLRLLNLHDNALSGPIPPQVGNMGQLQRLRLQHNDLEGPAPAELGGLTGLRELDLAYNRELSGSVPNNFTALDRLDRLQAGGTGLCAPSDAAFQEWLKGVRDRWLPLCVAVDGGTAYLTQAVQSSISPVPLVAGETALLRVFVTAERTTEVGMPPVRATFYSEGAEAHVVNIPGQSNPIPTEIDESEFLNSANARIPAEVVQPGLEMVIEIDPDATLDPELGVTRRIPETGRSMVDVRELPPLELTLIPFLWSPAPDHAVLEHVSGMAANPDEHERLFDTRRLLPVAELDVTAHEPVMSSSVDFRDLLAEAEAIRVAEGIDGYVMGMITGRLSRGTAYVSGRTSFSTPDAGTIAHELGHNFSLLHAPCNVSSSLDAAFPEPNGRIGAWGYDERDGGKLLWPSSPDLMSYCRPRWIGPYNFSRALRYRLAEATRASTATMAAPARSFLVWGGIGADGTLYLEPAFVIDAPPALPESEGAYEITALTTAGFEAFSFRFDVPEVTDGEGGSGFAYAVPVRPSWQASLSSITLTGPGGRVTMDADTNRPMIILRNPRNGQIRGILRDLPVDGLTRSGLADLGVESELEVLVSRGIPDAAAWRR